MEKKFVELRKSNYIRVDVISNTGNQLYYLKENMNMTEPYKFKNFDIARFTAKHILKDRKIRYVFHLNDLKRDIPMDHCQFINGYYQYYDLETDTKYYIREIKLRQIHRVGYLCFENGDVERCDKEYGNSRQRELFKWLVTTIDGYMATNQCIYKKERITGKSWVLYIKDSTAKIHINANSRIMDINQDLKAKGKRCIPYNRNHDKFLTFHVYADADIQEKIYIQSGSKISKAIEDIIECLHMDIPEDQLDTINPKWVELPFNGYILMEE